LAVLLLFPFHTLRVFNADDPFYVKAEHLSMAVSYLLGFISVWHMPLLFVLAGASTYFALGKRSSQQYLWERLVRLGLPFVFGVFVLIPPQTWYGGRFNSGYSASYWHYLVSGDFLRMNIRDGGDYYGGFGIGHLWFILVLLIVAIAVLPLLAWAKGGRGAAFVQRFSRLLARPWGWLLAAFLLLLASALPELELEPFLFLAFFVLGFAVVADSAFMAFAERHWRVALGLGVALAVLKVATWEARESLPDPSLELAVLSLLGLLGSWLMIVGLLGLGKRLLDRTSPALAYLAEASYPVYILHQTVIVVAAFTIVALPAAEPLQWLILLVVSVAVTYALYEVVRRIGALRVLFGMRPKRNVVRAAPAGVGAAPAGEGRRLAGSRADEGGTAIAEDDRGEFAGLDTSR
jgi:peptidoglycan/LPS O-acetylase OafA/YrhL